ncbi:MAG: hypothetical protein AAFO87_17050 [Cyanobacteria bacterium J06607_6]
MRNPSPAVGHWGPQRQTAVGKARRDRDGLVGWLPPEEQPA